MRGGAFGPRLSGQRPVYLISTVWKGAVPQPGPLFETAATNGHAVYWLEEHGEPLMRPAVRIITAITELCGTMPVEDACRLMAACWGATKVFYQAPLNVLDPVLCSQCDSYALSTRGNIRLLRPERVLVALAVPRVPEGAAAFWQRGKGSIYRCESARCMCAGVFRRGCRFIRTTSWFTPCLA